MLRVQQHGTEASVRLIVRLEVDLNLAHSLKIIEYGAFGSLNLISKIILTSRCHAARRDRSDRPVRVLRHGNRAGGTGSGAFTASDTLFHVYDTVLRVGRSRRADIETQAIFSTQTYIANSEYFRH